MSSSKSAEKRARQAEEQRLRNRAVKSTVKTAIRKAEREVIAGESSAPELVRLAVRALDKAAQKGVLHPNNAARRKSRLMRKLATTR